MSEKDLHSAFHDLLPRYLSGGLEPTELARFQQALDKHPELQKELADYEKIWQGGRALGQEAAYDLDAEWEQMHRQLPGFGTVEEGKVRRLSLLQTVYRIAAILVLGLILGLGSYMVLRLTATTQVVARDALVPVVLPDGSELLLNHHSKISYHKKFDGNKRQVRLSGEAYFEVARDPDRPFVIHAGSAQVEVLGTSFNVQAYRDAERVEITVESGVVALSAKGEPGEQIVLKAGNSGSYESQEKALTLYPSVDRNKLGWKTQELFFDHTPLGEVAEVISHSYHVDVEIPNSQLQLCPLTASFEGQDLESVLEVLAFTMDLEIEKNNGQIRLLGTACAE
jgi:ferric-dicitrate binding protein FerR (iron transport regulator)